MKKYLTLLLLFASCVSEEDQPFLKYSDRVTTETLSQVEAALGVYFDTTDSIVSKYITLEIEGRATDTLLVSEDSTLVSTFIHENGWSSYGGPISNDIYFFMSNYFYNQNEFKVLVSGQVKASHPKDRIPGLPFVIEKIETLPPCPVSFEKSESTLPLQGTEWNWKGFLNEANEVYSYPSCENPLVTFQLTERIVDSPSQGYINPMKPNAMYLEIFPGFYFYDAYSTKVIYEIEDNHLNLFGTFWYGPNRHPNSPIYFTTRQTAEKADSLKLLLKEGNLTVPEVVDYIIEGNQLILSHRKTKLRALFIAD